MLHIAYEIIWTVNCKRTGNTSCPVFLPPAAPKYEVHLHSKGLAAIGSWCFSFCACPQMFSCKYLLSYELVLFLSSWEKDVTFFTLGETVKIANIFVNIWHLLVDWKDKSKIREKLLILNVVARRGCCNYNWNCGLWETWRFK